MLITISHLAGPRILTTRLFSFGFRQPGRGCRFFDPNSFARIAGVVEGVQAALTNGAIVTDQPLDQ